MAGEKTPLIIKEDFEIPRPTSSWLGASFIMANIVLGSGLLNFPNAYYQAGGILSTLIIEFGSLLFVQTGIVIIGHCADLSRKDNYQDSVEYFVGRIGLIFCNIFIVVHDFGACTTFLVIVADQMDQVMLYVAGSSFCHYWYMNRYFTVTIVATVFILPFCFPKEIASFRFGSILGILTTVYLFILVIIKYFDPSTALMLEDVQIAHGPSSWVDVFKTIPTIVFSFEAHIEGVPIYASLKKRTLGDLTKTIMSSTIICVIVYNFVGIFGYLTFGQYVKSDILANYYPIDIPVIIGMAMVALKCVMTFPPVFFCARMVMMDVFGSKCQSHWGWSERRQRVVITIGMFIFSVFMALMVPSIGSIIALLGGSAALFIFIFPGLCLFKAYLNAQNFKEKLIRTAGIVFATIGAFLIGTVTSQSIIRYMSGEFDETEIECI